MRTTSFCLLVLIAYSGCNQQKISSVAKTTTSDQERVEPFAALPVGPGIENPAPLAVRPGNIQLAEPQDVSFGTTEPTIIDTRDFAKQVYRTEPFAGEQLSGDLSRFVQPGTRTVSARLTMERQLAGNQHKPRFFSSIDIVEWAIAE